MATSPNPRPSKVKKALPKPSANLKKSDYLYALEVAGQPAKSKADKMMQRQAKANVKYLENKFPKYTTKMKSTEGRNAPSTPKVKIVDNTRTRKVPNGKTSPRVQ